MALASSTVLALALTACGEGDAESESVGTAATEPTDTTVTPTATAASVSASASASTSATATGQATKGAGSQGSGNVGGTGAGATKTSSAGTGSGSAKPLDCTTGSLKFAVKEVKSPINHVLITATNTGSKACSIYSYPALRLSDVQQSVTARIGQSKPQAVVTLDRGATAYAGLITASVDRNSQTKVTTSSIGLSLFGPDEGPTESGADLPVPGGSLYVELDNALVTYWQDNANDALAW
ncbi:DUF4232 domain-containing protein [Streptomyces flaveus]|uniref:DUF4232 domain-containing protein n=1 Tax=Streptomyces flaveus TaxID=66370 RepID=UPI00167135E8|nr:DUF4232 domain-containing protein [Streptomyces flaveus]